MKEQVLIQQEHEQIAEEIASARRHLIDAGFPAEDKRFPFLMHHIYVRGKIRGGYDGRRTVRHSEIASLLAQWAVQHGGAQTYAWQAISAAIAYMYAQNAALTNCLPDTVRDGIIRNLAGKPSLLKYVQARIDEHRANSKLKRV